MERREKENSKEVLKGVIILNRTTNKMRLSKPSISFQCVKISFVRVFPLFLPIFVIFPHGSQQLPHYLLNDIKMDSWGHKIPKKPWRSQLESCDKNPRPMTEIICDAQDEKIC